MAHLVKPLLFEQSAPQLTTYCQALIQEAHDYLVQCVLVALKNKNLTENHPYWGSRIKRIRVTLSGFNRPELIDTSITDHNLTEIYNQCATMERLLDALNWITLHLPDYKVVRCHPTTSSHKHATIDSVPDNDIVLINPAGDFARFEVSDVISDGDGNQKEVKDLISLGVLGAKSGAKKYLITAWPVGRLFLVTSPEFAVRLRKRIHGWPISKPHYRYDNVKADGETNIFEVFQA